MRIAIIADDLTGALDTGAPFVRHGVDVAVAVSMAGLAGAAGSDAEMVVVNTGSRQLSEPEAAARVAEAASALLARGPEIVFKKVDSRLQGHVRAETAALGASLRPRRLLVAPAVPDQGRSTRQGRVIGSGVAAPISIAPIFAGLPFPVTIGDAETDADLDALAAGIDSGTLAVGARGLGAALARRFGSGPAQPLAEAATSRVLIAVGSRDPITARQVAHLRARHPELSMLEAVDGLVPPTRRELPLLAYCGGPVVAARATSVVRRFAGGIAELVARLRPECLWLTGGETALAVLEALDVSLLRLLGEVAPGVPLVACTRRDGSRMRCVLKSGGFGGADVLEAALPRDPERPAQ